MIGRPGEERPEDKHPVVALWACGQNIGCGTYTASELDMALVQVLHYSGGGGGWDG